MFVLIVSCQANIILMDKLLEDKSSSRSLDNKNSINLKCHIE